MTQIKITGQSLEESVQLFAEHIEGLVHDIEVRQAALELVVGVALKDLLRRGHLPDVFPRSLSHLQQIVADGKKEQKRELVAAIERLRRMAADKD